MNSVIIGAIRTITPMLVGWLVTALALPETTTQQLEGALFVIISGAYYVVARWVEERFPKAGWLLGYNAEPVYLETETEFDIMEEDEDSDEDSFENLDDSEDEDL